MSIALALLISYLVGSIPTAYLLIQRVKGIDIRSVGSGNVGATNALRVAGKGAGVAVFLLDAAKGVIAVRCLAPWLVHPLTPTVQLACGLMAVVGHTAPIFLGFKGGKGVATAIGVLLGVVPLIAGIGLVVWVLCFLLWRYVSVASLVAIVSVPVMQWLMHRQLSEIGLGVLLALLIVVRHQANIARLRQGTEHQFKRPMIVSPPS